MPQNNLRIIYDNAIDRATTLTADTTAGTMGPTALQRDGKSDVHRTTQRSVAYRATWTAGELLGGVFITPCNYSDTATMRTRASKESAATNLALYSEDFTNAAWTKTSITVTANSSVAPDGNTTADHVVFSGSGQTLTQSTALGTGVICSSSFWVKGTSGQTIQVGAGGVDQLFSLNGSWQRLVNANRTSVNSTITLNTNGGATARDLQVWGAQLETGAVSTSYYPTASAAATRPLGYIDSWQSYDYDSGVVTACPGGGVSIRNWNNTPAGANAYAYGAGATARNWLTTQDTFKGLAVDINDPSNTATYLEAARLIVGAYWAPTYNAEYEAPLTPIDNSRNFENDAGDTISILGTKKKKQQISLAHMPLADRDKLWDILWGNGTTIPIMFSLYPNDSSGKLERTHQLYAKLVALPAIATPFYYRYSATIDLQEA